MGYTPITGVDDSERRLSYEGKQMARTMYGQDLQQTGRDVQAIKRRREQRLSGGSPGQAELREARYRQVAMATARGASPAEVRQIEAGAQMRVAREGFRQEGQALGDYQGLIGNFLKGQSGLILGHKALGVASQQQQVAQPSSGTVVCTAMHYRDDISDRELHKTQYFGARIKKRDPELYFGYLNAFTPIAEKYRISNWFRKLSRPFFMAVVNEITGLKPNCFGRFLYRLGAWYSRRKYDGEK